MLRRVTVAVGRGFRETGQAIERMGARAQDSWIYGGTYGARQIKNSWNPRAWPPHKAWRRTHGEWKSSLAGSRRGFELEDGGRVR